MFVGIKFLTGSRSNSTFAYKDKNLLKLNWTSPPCEPLHLTDLKAIELLSPGFLGLDSLIKCIFVNGDEELAEIDYATLTALQIFLFNKNTSTLKDNYIILPKRRHTITYYALLALIIIGSIAFILSASLK